MVPSADALLTRLRELVPQMQRRAAELDRTEGFPAEDLAEFNRNIVGLIEVAAELSGPGE